MTVKTYLFSLPERLVRSLLGLSAGAAREVGELVLPAGVRRTQLYRNIVAATLRLLIEKVGGVEGVYGKEDEALPQQFLARRSAGNAIEALGLVAFRASPMAPGARLTKLSVFSDTVRSPLEAEWLLQLDPSSEVAVRADGLEAALAGAVLELHWPINDGSRIEWQRHAVAKPEVEPFTFRETNRVVVRPPFSGQDAFLLTLLRARGPGDSALSGVSARRDGARLRLAFTLGGTPTAVDWDLADFTVTLDTSGRR